MKLYFVALCSWGYVWCIIISLKYLLWHTLKCKSLAWKHNWNSEWVMAINGKQQVWIKSSVCEAAVMQTMPCVICSRWREHWQNLKALTQDLGVISDYCWLGDLWPIRCIENCTLSSVVVASSSTLNAKEWIFMSKQQWYLDPRLQTNIWIVEIFVSAHGTYQYANDLCQQCLLCQAIFCMQFHSCTSSTFFVRSEQSMHECGIKMYSNQQCSYNKKTKLITL